MPSTIERLGDGRYGLGGILHGAYGGARTATMTLDDEELRETRIRWDLCVKASSAKDRLTLEVGTASEPVDATRAPVGTLVHLERETLGAHRIRVRMNTGNADLCGVYAATDPAERPGVLVDTLGINGARYATALAWEEESWAAEMRRRPTDLVVFEYGGNEASDPTPRPETYRRDAEALIARVRRAAPEAGCLVVGPADRADKETTIPVIVRAVRDAAHASGCAFWDTWAKMGGKGSLARWREEKKAAPDGIHLFPKGYAELAALFTEDLLASYAKD
jgi:lysophospholipase L1-like esterase